MDNAREEFTTLLAVRLDETLGEDLHPLFLARLAAELAEGDISEGARAAMTSDEARRARVALQESLGATESAAA